MDFWQVLRLLVPIDIPEYIRDLLSASGFDNFLAMKSLDENVLKEIEKQVEDEDKTKNFKRIALGHKIMLLGIRDIIQNTSLEAIAKIEKGTVTETAGLKRKDTSSVKSKTKSKTSK